MGLSMSRCLANDASLEGQFASLADFISALRFWISAERSARKLGFRLEVNRSICSRSVIGGAPLKAVVNQHHDQDLKRALLRWFDLTGPFWDDTPLHSPGEYYEAHGNLVTETALAEICTLLECGEQAVPISLTPSSYSTDEIKIDWIGRATGDWSCTVRNFTALEGLESFLSSIRRPFSNWAELIEHINENFTSLLLATDLIDRLPTTFYPNVAQRTWVLLNALNQINSALLRGEQPRFNELRTSWMEGQSARITDSSDTEKNEFREDLTFRHPLTGQKIFCPWHAKIKTPQYRIHFEWPKANPAEPLFIGYIGPKLTKT